MWKKYLWQVLGALLAVTGIIATYDIFFRSRPVKELQVMLNSAAPLISDTAQLPESVPAIGNLQVIFNNNDVLNAVIYQVTVKNTGNQPIVAGDYIQPLSFYFMAQDEIISLVVTASDPANIGMVLHKTSSYQAVVDPVLLNPGDTVSMNFIVAIPVDGSIKERFHVGGRIVGIPEIDLVTSPKPVLARLDLKNISVFSVMGVLAGVFSSFVYEKIYLRTTKDTKKTLDADGQDDQDCQEKILDIHKNP